MKRALLAATALLAVTQSPAHAQRHGGGGGFGSAFTGSLLGSAVGSVLGNAVSQPAPPPPATVFIAPPPPPVIYERRVYVAPPPVYVPPAAHVSYHPWPGPGFACYEPEPNSVTRAICGSQDLSAASLALTEAVDAAAQQTPYSARAVHGELASYMQGVKASCAPYAYQQQVDCISGMLSHDRDIIVGRLGGVYADEANRPVLVNVQVQQRLHEMGLLPGTADGIYGDGTRRAISNWQSGQGHPASGVLTTDEVAMLVPGFQGPYVPPAMAQQPIPAPLQKFAATQAATQPAPALPPVAPPAVQQAVAVQTVTATDAPTDILGGLHENMPYAIARPKLFAAGWQTQFFKPEAMSDQARETRAWFTDHHIMEVEDCSSSGCKMQLHNADGRLLYVYTQAGSHDSDAYKGAGPSVIAYCLDHDDITCPAPAAPAGAKQALK